MENEEILTPEEKEKLEEELEKLKSVDRAEVIEELKVARSYGDLRENSEYDTARKKQGMIESRIAEIEAVLKTAVVSEGTGGKGGIMPGSDVEVEVVGEGTKTYSIGHEGKGVSVSLHSVIGEQLIGKQAGDKVTVALPKKEVEMVIKKVS
ncbi:MAG: GreA/GreB family elongation factor [Candidatus Kaiserbacteria bacterium]|nr:GreA/GreB family elongation factor [Candidatus Kaiserbacteria bacterium]